MIDNKIKNTIKHPTSLIVNGVSNLGLELASSLLEQGGYVIIVDAVNEDNFYRIVDTLGDNVLVSFIDYSDIPYLEEDVRRLDYTFYLQHEVSDPYASVSTQAFLRMANYLDAILSLNITFESKFLLATSLRASYELMRLEYDTTAASVSRAQPQYLEMDIHKYAESLTLEYVEKADLAGRVVRVGEIIGDGLDLGKKCIFNRLLVQAVRGEKLQIPGDGLDTEYYVHLLDSAYGIIKAQFTPETVGKIYSVAYDVPITNLSIAYRLQELEPNARDIEFGHESATSTGNSLRLQRKSVSLSQLGWQPRIDFDQAISESIVAAKAANIDKVLDLNGDETGLLGKVKSFLALAQTEDEVNPEELEGNPVSRLIAERQHQEKVRDASFDRADDYLRRKRNTRNLSFSERFSNYVWKQFQKVQGWFGFLSETTPLQFLMWIILTVFLGLVYFGVFAPILVMGRNLIVAQEQLSQVEEQLAVNDFIGLESSTQALKDMTAENSQMLDRLSAFTSFFGTKRFIDDAAEINQAYVQLADGAAELSYAARPIGDYLSEFTSNLRFRGNVENYIGVGNSASYSSQLELLEERQAYLDTGLEKLNVGVSALRQLGSDNVLLGYFQEINSGVLEEADRLESFSGLLEFLPQILAAKEQQHYLIMMLDNTRPMPLGGKLAAVAELVVQDGAVVDAKVQASSDFDLPKSSLPDYTQDLLLLAAEDDETSFTNLDHIQDPGMLSDILNTAWLDYYGTELDGVILLTASGLEQMLPSQSDGEVPVTIEGVDFTNTNLISSINGLQGSNGASRRNDLFAQLLAQIIVNKLDSVSDNFDGLVRDLASLNRTEDLIFAASDPDLNTLVVEANTDGSRAKRESDLDLQFYAKADTRISTGDHYPNVSQSSLVEIVASGDVLYESIFRFPNLDNVESVAVCLPAIAQSIEILDTESTGYSQQKINNRICLNLPSNGINEVALKWQVGSLASDNENEYNLSLGFSKPTGIELTSNVEVQLAPTLDLNYLEPPVSVVANQFGVTEDLDQDQIINLNMTK